MATISASEVNKLRQHTGAGMMDCKKALENSNGDFDEAITYLRKQGAKVSTKRSDKEANEGRVEAVTNNQQTAGVILAANCETDFVAKNEDFTHFTQKVAQAALEHKPADKEGLGQIAVDDTTVNTMLEDQMAKIGEKLTISSYHYLEGGYVVGYNHFGNQIGVLVAFNKSGDHITQPAQDIAMQIAAMSAMAVKREDIPEDAIQQELEIAKDQARQDGKPDHIVDKIAEGKLNKFYKENTLLEQEFVKDSDKTVKDFLAEIDSELEVKSFKRIAIGGN